MHSCCLISGIQQGDRSPRGPSEYDKHPAFKLRKATLAHEKRLTLKLANLDQQCQDMTSRMAHSMRMTTLALRQIQNKESRCKSIYTSPSNRSTVESKNTKVISNKKAQHDYPIHDSSIKAKFQSEGHKRDSEYNLKFPPIENHDQGKSDNNKMKPRQKRTYFGRCSFGTTKEGKCSHFPCHQPKTYHSLGFRLDDSSTQQWITWADFKKAKIGLPDYNTASNIRAANTSEQTSELRRWCSLPMDFESRKQRLKEEIEKRRIQNMANKPKSWVTNYGKLTPYKMLAYPIRLHPLQMTTK